MKRSSRAAAFAVIVIIVSISCGRQAEVPAASERARSQGAGAVAPGAVTPAGTAAVGIDKLARLDLLPRFKRSVRVGLVSSYDRTGGNDDGFSGKYSFVRREPGGLVLADLEGPGAITRIHTPTPTDDVVEFYFDGETAPGLSLKVSELFDCCRSPLGEWPSKDFKLVP